MSKKSKSKSSSTNTTTYNTQNSAVSGDVEEGAVAASGNSNNIKNFSVEDEIGRLSLADVSGNAGTVTMTHDGAFTVVESVALSAIEGIQDTSKESLKETVNAIEKLQKTEETGGNSDLIQAGIYIGGGVAAVAILAKALGSSS